jgi:hypothetical protein
MIPECCLPVNLLPPAADAGGRTSSAYPSLKGANRAYIVCYIDQGNAATIALTPKQATAVAGTGTKVITACSIYTNEDAAGGVAFTKQTDAANFTTSAAVKNKVVIFVIEPTKCLDVAGGFDCVGLTTGASHAANITSAALFVDLKFKGAVPINALID